MRGISRTAHACWAAIVERVALAVARCTNLGMDIIGALATESRRSRGIARGEAEPGERRREWARRLRAGGAPLLLLVLIVLAMAGLLAFASPAPALALLPLGFLALMLLGVIRNPQSGENP